MKSRKADPTFAGEVILCFERKNKRAGKC